MRAESTNGKIRWTDEEISKLRELHDKALSEPKSHIFSEKLASHFKPRSVASVVEECRRLGLKPKRNPRSEICTYECGIVLTPDNRIGDVCCKCYNRKWYRDSRKTNTVIDDGID
jgi:hypothetical protein